LPTLFGERPEASAVRRSRRVLEVQDQGFDMADKQKFYITTAISYPNGAPHIGHAYEVVASDAIARFKRIDGYDVFFMTGTDEHGLKIQQTADKNDTTPKAFVDEMAAKFKAMADRLNCSYDRFIRTTDADHVPSTQELWRRMQEKGDIYLSKYSGWYSVRDEAYYDEAELTKQPDGSWRAPTGTPVEWIEEESYFFRLSAYQDRLLAHYEAHQDFISPETRRNEITSFVRSGLQDLSISRTTFNWGLPVPGDPKHVMYVWIDALNNYVTGCGFPNENDPRWQYWPADVHIIGKDIVRFHTVYWPAFLMSAELPLPKRVFGHGFLLNKGEKMSKSVGNVVDPFDLADTYGVDQIRYFFMREVPFGQDGNYSHEAIVNRINADLANDLGNLAQRSLTMIAKNCDASVPQPGEFTQADQDMLWLADALPAKTRAAMKDFALHTTLAEIWAVVAEANRYFASQEPWVLRKTSPERMNTVLYVTAEVLRAVGILAQPFVPTAAAKLLDLLAVPPEGRGLAAVGPEHRLAAGTALPQPAPIFPRYLEAEAS
jgi:methionyl-tRNA synthetase